MNASKIESALEEIEGDVPIEGARVSIRFMWGGDVTTNIRATRNGLIRLGIELIRTALKSDPTTERVKSLLLPDEDILLEFRDHADQVQPHETTAKEMRRFKIGEFLFPLFLFGFAGLGVISLLFYVFR